MAAQDTHPESIGFVTRVLESYRLCPSEDGRYLGVILQVSGQPPQTMAIPQESLARLLHEIEQADRTLRSRRAPSAS